MHDEKFTKIVKKKFDFKVVTSLLMPRWKVLSDLPMLEGSATVTYRSDRGLFDKSFSTVTYRRLAAG